MPNDYIIIGAVYIRPLSEPSVYRELCLAVEELTHSYPDHGLIIMGDFNLPRVIWCSNPFHADMTGYLDPGERESVSIICSTMSSLNLIQHFSMHPSKGYTLDLGFAPEGMMQYQEVSEAIVSSDPKYLVS